MISSISQSLKSNDVSNCDIGDVDDEVDEVVVDVCMVVMCVVMCVVVCGEERVVRVECETEDSNARARCLVEGGLILGMLMLMGTDIRA